MKQNPSIIYLLACLWCWAPLAQLQAVTVSAFLSGSPPPAPAGYTANTAGFAASQYGRITTTPAGMTADSSQGTCSFWYNPAGSDTADFLIFAIGDTTTNRLQIFRSNAGKLVVEGYTSGGTQRLNMISTTSIVAAAPGMDGTDGWVKVFIVWDQNNSANCKMYFNGATNDAPTVTVSMPAIDTVPTTPRFTIGGNSSTSPGFLLNGALSEFIFYDTLHDTPAAFYSGTSPVDGGATGAVFTGSAPDIYLSQGGSGDAWLTGWTVAGGTITTPAAP